MKLSDVMSSMHMTIYAELPLLIFVGIFVGVALHLLQGEKNFEDLRTLPLADESPKGKQER
jgi:hypothetical protein